MSRRANHRPHSSRNARLLLAVLLAALGLGAAYEAFTWPDVAALARQNPKTTAFIERYQTRMRQAGKKPGVAWQWVPYSEISPNLKRAVLVSEDISFFSHRGFDLAEIWDAVKESFQDVEFPRGASTLTQQVAKNLWLSPAQNPVRKLKEAILTIQLEHDLKKRRIFELYLNIVEFGPGIYGVEAAARHYFLKPAKDLSEEEAAQLVAGLPKPSAWHPGSESRAYQKRVAIILERMQTIEINGNRL